MSNYIKENLCIEESIVYETKVHWIVLVIHIFLMFVYIGFITIIPALIYKYKTELVITDRRISGKKGLFTIEAMESPLNKIQNVKIKQGLLGQILNYGDIFVTTAGGEYLYRNICKPKLFKMMVNQNIDKYNKF